LSSQPQVFASSKSLAPRTLEPATGARTLYEIGRRHGLDLKSPMLFMWCDLAPIARIRRRERR
jgi:hypothetical protein